MNKSTIFSLLVTSTLAAPLLNAQTPTAVAPDNSKTNRANANSTATADAQSNSSADLDLTKRIRQSVIADKSLSTYAHNIKIVALNGSVTLNGVVRSEEEKAAIEMKAAEIAGKGRVNDELKVAPSK